MELTTNYSYLYYTSVPIILGTLYFFKFYKNTPQNSPPTPGLSLPLIGHFHLLYEPFHESLATLSNRFGPILLLWFGSRPVLLISSPEAAEECLSRNDVVFCNRPRGFLVSKHLAFDYTSLIWAPYGPHWRNLRRIAVVEMLSSQRLKALASIRSDEVKRMIQRLHKICNVDQVNQKLKLTADTAVIELKPLLYEVSMNVMTRMVFGKRYYGVEGEEEISTRKFREMLEKMLRLFNEACIGDMIPCLRWLDWCKERKLKRFVEERKMVLKEVIEEHRKVLKMGDKDGKNINGVKPLIGVLLEFQEDEPEYYTDEVIFGLILDLLIGSSDTSAETMEWALSLLLNHPQVLNKAKIEINNLIGHQRLIEESDLNQLPYLECIINETLRMYPPAPTLVPHESSEHCIVGGYHIPRGTMLQINLWAIQNDPNIWDDPASFRPERFEGVEGHKIGYKMMPFGSGRRSCPGEGLANRVIGLSIGSLIQCFELDRVDDKVVDMGKASGFTLQKAQPLRALVKPCLDMINLLEKIM